MPTFSHRRTASVPTACVGSAASPQQKLPTNGIGSTRCIFFAADFHFFSRQLRRLSRRIDPSFPTTTCTRTQREREKYTSYRGFLSRKSTVSCILASEVKCTSWTTTVWPTVKEVTMETSPRDDFPTSPSIFSDNHSKRDAYAAAPSHRGGGAIAYQLTLSHPHSRNHGG